MVAVKSFSRFDSGDLTILSVIRSGQFSHQTPHGYRATMRPGDYIAFEGYAFSYYGGRPLRGITETLTVYENNTSQYQFSGLSITISEFIRYSHMTGEQLSKQIFAGNDVFVGSGKADRVEGYEGNDTYIVKNAATQVVEKAGDGNDTVRVDFSAAAGDLDFTGEALSNFSFSLAGNAIVENLFAFALASTYALNLGGNGISNKIKGNAGINDIDGGGGNDMLWGGRGRDTFVFDLGLTPGNCDTIKDFNVGGAPDTIELSRAVFRSLDLGRLDPAEFKALKPASSVDANDHILYNRKSGWLSYDPDGQGGIAAKAFAKIDNHAVLTFDDFLVVA